MPTIEIDGGRVRYDDLAPASEDGVPVVLVHAWCGDASHWAAQRDALGEHRRLIVPDLPWHGGSDRVGAVTMERFTDVLAELVESVVGGPVVVVGHSMGAVVAVGLAARRPDLVRGLATLEGVYATPPEFLAGLRGLLAELDGRGAHAALRGLAESLHAPTDDPDRRTELVEQMMAAPSAVHTGALASMLEFMSGPGDELLTGLTVPTAFVTAPTGFSDPERLAELGRVVQVVEVTGCGHYPQIFASGQVNEVLRRFVDRIPA